MDLLFGKVPLTHTRILKGIKKAKDRAYLIIDSCHKDNIWGRKDVQSGLLKLLEKDCDVRILTNDKTILPVQLMEHSGARLRIKEQDESFYDGKFGITPCI